MSVSRTEPLPMDFQQVDANWLSKTLQSRYPGIAVENMEVLELVQGHTTKARIKWQLNDTGIAAGLPDQVCLKANWSGSPLSSPVCVNEARFYGELASKLPLPAPTCYFADWDDTASYTQGFIILEDLIPVGGEFGGSHLPIGADDMAKSLEGMARLHGVTWNHPELNRQQWLQQAMAPDTVTDDYWGMMTETFEAHNQLPERLAIFPKWMLPDTNRLYTAFKQLCAHDYANQGPRCLVHGDAHLGNSYRKPDGDRIWFDWQIVRKGLPWRDLTYFMVGSMTIEDRRKADRELIQHYLDHLKANGGPDFSFDQALEEFSRWVIWGLVGWQSNINPKESTMGPLERFCRAADDYDTGRFYQF